MAGSAMVGADFGGIEFSTTALVDADTMLLISGRPVLAEIKFERPDQPRGMYIDRMQMSAYAHMLTKTLKRPSWLHPIKRVLWVHHHGPHRPTVQVPQMNLRSMGVIRNVA